MNNFTILNLNNIDDMEIFNNLYYNVLLSTFSNKILLSYDSLVEIISNSSNNGFNIDVYSYVENGESVCAVIRKLKKYKCAYLSMLAVDSNNRGKGIGSEFVSKLIESLKLDGFKYLFFTLENKKLSDNEETIFKILNFYKKFGARRVNINYVFPSMADCGELICNNDLYVILLDGSETNKISARLLKHVLELFMNLIYKDCLVKEESLDIINKDLTDNEVKLKNIVI